MSDVVETRFLPLLPLSTGVVLPQMVVPLGLESDEAKSAADAARAGDGLLVLVPRIETDGGPTVYAKVGTVAGAMNLMVHGGFSAPRDTGGPGGRGVSPRQWHRPRLGSRPRAALVAQGIEHRPPEPCAQVRILPRALLLPLITPTSYRRKAGVVDGKPMGRLTTGGLPSDLAGTRVERIDVRRRTRRVHREAQVTRVFMPL